tara:strand:- start:579 stop:740 length:162 start_codon:yes stop_codon:yes gene_type:complete
MDHLKKHIARLESENAFLKEIIYTQYKKAKTAYNLIERFEKMQDEEKEENFKI